MRDHYRRVGKRGEGDAVTTSGVFAVLAVLAVLAAFAAGCRPADKSDPYTLLPAPEAPAAIGARRGLALCTKARSEDPIPQRRNATTRQIELGFADVRTGVNKHCGRCHLAPSSQGAFSYRDIYAKTDPKDKSTVPLLPDVAQKMVTSILMPMSEAKRMPPPEDNPDPPGALQLGRVLQAWIKAGLPAEGTMFPPPSDDSPGAGTGGTDGANGGSFTLSSSLGEAMTNLGACVPSPGTGLVGTKMPIDLDEMFEQATELPKELVETDLTTLDTQTLAEKGVVAFAPTYPLWADDARKVRQVRVPRGQHIVYDSTTKQFKIPPNTRFYKTFFKRVIEADGHVGYRKIETRLIVSRPAEVGPNGVRTEKALFGSYLWNDAETEARLIDDPYVSGKPFKDHIFKYVNDETTGATRTYAVPGAHRCVQCHMGAEVHDFVLGFTPLQINRRAQGEGGVIEPVGDDELTQVDRLLSYGVVTGFYSAADLPQLEDSAGDRRARNIHELRAQAYMTGNCSHCHNPEGFPVLDEPRLRPFNLRPGGVMFQFPTDLVGYNLGVGGRYVNPLDLAIETSKGASLIYRRVGTPTTRVQSFDKGEFQTFLVVPHMPANTPGFDCRAPQLIGRWISSIPLIAGSPNGQIVQDAERAAETRVAEFDRTFTCNPVDANGNPLVDTSWNDEDFTDKPGYEPRRKDWAKYLEDPALGIPQEFRQLRIDDALADVAVTPYPYGYWKWKPDCQFPVQDPIPLNQERPWMFEGNVLGGRPARPMGEVYLQTPGEAIFLAVCSNCHGARADGNSGIAKTLYQLSAGLPVPIRVANLMEGLFGPRSNPGNNLLTFSRLALPGERPEWGAAKYLVWMGSGGTQVEFPKGFGFLIGDAKQHGGNMLTQVRVQCSRLLPQSYIEVGPNGRAEAFDSNFPVERDFWEHFCTPNNPIPSANARATEFEAWKRKAQFNGGIMMYFFFKDRAAHNIWPVPRDSCENKFPRSGP